MEIPENSYCGKHMFRPGNCFVSHKPFLKWEKKYLKKMEKENPIQAPTVLNRQVNIQSTGTFSYSYGNVDIRHIPILRSSKFLVIDGAGGSVVNMSRDDVHLVPSSSLIPLASNYGQVFLAVLHGLPMSNKIKLLKAPPEQPTEDDSAIPITFLLPTGTSLTLPELVIITAAYEIADEIYSCSGSPERMQTLAHGIEQEAASFASNGRTIIKGLELLKEEVRQRKKKVSNARVSLAITEINRHISNIKRNLRRAGVNDGHLEELVPLEYLMSQEHIHRSHQHWIDDDRERWNLAGL